MISLGRGTLPATAAVVGLLLDLVAVPGAAIPQEMRAVLDQHNVYRCMHGIPRFTWDDAIAANAQAYANRGIYRHSAVSDRTVDGQRSGENLAWGSPTMSGTRATIAWYSEIRFTEPYGTADSMYDAVPRSQQIGHYTQMVWRASTRLGCGKGRATLNGMAGDFWVCQYGPGGNVVGQFTAQVVAPTESVRRCGGNSADVPSGGTAPAVPGNGANGCHLPPADGSRRQCETCFHGDQCSPSAYCCPFMKRCVNSPSTRCGSPTARCSPLCYDDQCDKATGCSCPQCGSLARDDWLAWATQLDSNTQSPTDAPCDGLVSGAAAGGAFSRGHLAAAALACGVAASFVGAWPS